MKKVKDKLSRFKDWQKKPFEVAPLSSEHHSCATCGTEFQGNFCPRCGQSASVGPRMSLLKTFQLFIDVWGIGNRSMFRTIRDLVLRPGYLINDYIAGHRSAYFPPFKLLFLLTTLSIIIGHGWNLAGVNYEVPAEISQEHITEISEGDMAITLFFEATNWVLRSWKEYPALMQLAFMFFAGVFFYGMFSKSRTGKWSYQEFFIGMVYMVDMTTIYTIVMQFFGVPANVPRLVGVLYFIPLKQMSGYPWWKSALLTLCAIGLTLAAFFVLIIVGFAFVSVFTSGVSD